MVVFDERLFDHPSPLRIPEDGVCEVVRSRMHAPALPVDQKGVVDFGIPREEDIPEVRVLVDQGEVATFGQGSPSSAGPSRTSPSVSMKRT
jgi:hypothetical protein